MYKPTTEKTKRVYFTESTNPGQLLVHCLHVRFEEISTLLAGSTRVSTRVTRQRGLTRLDYCFSVHAYKHLTAKGLPAAVIQPALKSNPGSCKKAPRVFLGDLNKQPPSQGDIMRDQISNGSVASGIRHNRDSANERSPIPSKILNHRSKKVSCHVTVRTSVLDTPKYQATYIGK